VLSFAEIGGRSERRTALGAGTVAVLACSEMGGIRLRSLAWELEETGTDLCVVPSLLDDAGPRTMVGPTAGLTLLHVDHPQRTGFRLVLKGLFDRCAAAAALIMLVPVTGELAAASWLHGRGPALFTHVRNPDGVLFKLRKEHVRCRPVVKPSLTGRVAGQQAIGAVLGGVSAARPAVGLELLFALRSANLRRASRDANPKSDNYALSATPLTES